VHKVLFERCFNRTCFLKIRKQNFSISPKNDLTYTWILSKATQWEYVADFDEMAEKQFKFYIVSCLKVNCASTYIFNLPKHLNTCSLMKPLGTSKHCTHATQLGSWNSKRWFSCVQSLSLVRFSVLFFKKCICTYSTWWTHISICKLSPILEKQTFFWRKSYNCIYQ
jgi:hypothetical protein